MKEEQAARDAIGALDGQDFGGRNIKVNEARPRTERGGGGQRGGQRNRWWSLRGLLIGNLEGKMMTHLFVGYGQGIGAPASHSDSERRVAEGKFK